MKQYINQIFSLIFGLSVFLFFAFFYQYHLFYQEQYQLFLFTGEYFRQTVWHVGGLAGYIGAFLTQFYYYPKIGALIIAALLVIIQELMLYLSTMLKRQSYWTLLTFIPSIIYWRLLCDENTMLTGVVALVMALLATGFYTLVEHGWSRVVTLLLGSFILYYFAGGVYIIFIFLSIILEYVYFENFREVSAYVGCIGGILIAVFLPWATSYIAQATLPDLYWGSNYFRYPVTNHSTFLLIWISVALIPFLFIIIPEIKKHVIIYTTAEFIGIAALIVLAIGQVYNGKKENLMYYDFMVRAKQWDLIIDKANHKSPNTPLSVSALNLALCQEGKLADKMFNYYQHGPQGLLPDFQRDFTLPLMTGEIYYYLGFINTAQRYAFEAMEAVPDYQKSGRVIKRLAQTNLINGEYKVALKYLKILQKSLFYRKFANKTIPLLWNEKAINDHPEYGWLRKCRPTEDFLFDENEKDVMLNKVFNHYKQNRMAYEYLMAYYLLTDNLQKFAKFFPQGANIGYDHIPYTYQQALNYIQANTRK
jgi:hypothetical protein